MMTRPDIARVTAAEADHDGDLDAAFRLHLRAGLDRDRAARRRARTRAVLAAIVLGGAALLALFRPAPAAAHDRYPLACCDERDCRPAAPGEIRVESGGWRIQPTGDRVPFDAARPSPDGGFHWCQDGQGRLRVIGGRPCFWAPGGLS